MVLLGNQSLSSKSALTSPFEHPGSLPRCKFCANQHESMRCPTYNTPSKREKRIRELNLWAFLIDSLRDMLMAERHGAKSRKNGEEKYWIPAASIACQIGKTIFPSFARTTNDVRSVIFGVTLNFFELWNFFKLLYMESSHVLQRAIWAMKS